MRIYVVRLIWNMHANVANKYATFLKNGNVWCEKRRYDKTKAKCLRAYLPACMSTSWDLKLHEISNFKLYLKESVVYQATVSTEDHNPPQTYVGWLKENSFKTRHSNLKSSFSNANKRNNTELNKYIWYLKENLTKFKVKQRILNMQPCTNSLLTALTYFTGRSMSKFSLFEQTERINLIM